MEMLQHAALFLLLIIISILFLSLWENRYWTKRDPSKKYDLFETAANFSLGASYKLMDGVAAAVYVFLLYDWVSAYGLNLQTSDSWLWFPLIYVLVDLSFYFTHLAMHKIRWFWAGHVTHHSSDRFNYSTALRQNFTVVLNGTLLILWIPLALIGLDKNMVLLALEINLFYQFLLHTEMPSILDRFGLVMNTPSHHRVHHGSKPDQIDRNFGGTFIVWDRLFGTFRPEAGVGEFAYGITRNQPSGYNPITLLFHEWRDMFKDLMAHRNIQVLFRLPGWVDEHDRLDKPAISHGSESAGKPEPDS